MARNLTSKQVKFLFASGILSHRLDGRKGLVYDEARAGASRKVAASLRKSQTQQELGKLSALRRMAKVTPLSSSQRKRTFETIKNIQRKLVHTRTRR